MLQVRKCLRETEGNLGKKKEDLGKKMMKTPSAWEIRKRTRTLREGEGDRERISQFVVIFFLVLLQQTAGYLKAR